jgi:hypothetical protein
MSESSTPIWLFLLIGGIIVVPILVIIIIKFVAYPNLGFGEYLRVLFGGGTDSKSETEEKPDEKKETETEPEPTITSPPSSGSAGGNGSTNGSTSEEPGTTPEPVPETPEPAEEKKEIEYVYVMHPRKESGSFIGNWRAPNNFDTDVETCKTRCTANMSCSGFVFDASRRNFCGLKRGVSMPYADAGSGDLYVKTVKQ